MLDVPEHFLVERILKTFQVFGHLRRIGVLRLQVLDDFRIFLVTQPVVVVDDGFTVANVTVLDAFSEGRLRHGFCYCETT